MKEAILRRSGARVSCKEKTASAKARGQDHASEQGGLLCWSRETGVGMEKSLVSVPPPSPVLSPLRPPLCLCMAYTTHLGQAAVPGDDTIFRLFSSLWAWNILCVFKMVNMGWVLLIETPSQFLGPGALKWWRRSRTRLSGAIHHRWQSVGAN